MLARQSGNTRIIQVDQRTGKEIHKNIHENAKPTLKANYSSNAATRGLEQPNLLPKSASAGIP